MYTIRQNARINHIQGLHGKCGSIARSATLVDGGTYETLDDLNRYLDESARRTCGTCLTNLVSEVERERRHEARVEASMVPVNEAGEPTGTPVAEAQNTECSDCRGAGCHWCYWTGAVEQTDGEIEPEASMTPVEVKAVMDSEAVGELHCNGDVKVVVRMRGMWRVVGTGIAGADLHQVMEAFAVRAGVTGPVTYTVVPPSTPAPAPADNQVTEWPVFRVGIAQYHVSPRVKAPYGGVDYVEYRWTEHADRPTRRAYATDAQGTVPRQLWDARYDYDLNEQR